MDQLLTTTTLAGDIICEPVEFLGSEVGHLLCCDKFLQKTNNGMSMDYGAGIVQIVTVLEFCVKVSYLSLI